MAWSAEQQSDDSGEVQHAKHDRLANDQDGAGALRTGGACGCQQRRDAGAVEEGDAGEVEYQAAYAAAAQGRDGGAVELRGVGKVYLAGDRACWLPGRAGSGRAAARAKVGDSELGWLALVDRVENRVDDGRELVNQCAALLTVALDLRDQEAQLLRAAHSDRLTGPPNRSSFIASLEAATGRRSAVLFLDPDGFKEVNDTLGHHAGDHLLVCVAARLQQCLRSEDVAARFGGDELVVLLGDVTPGPDLERLVERLRTAICAPYQLGDQAAQIGVSIGWADCATGTTAEQLLQEADRSMYEAKAARTTTVLATTAGQGAAQPTHVSA